MSKTKQPLAQFTLPAKISSSIQCQATTQKDKQCTKRTLNGKFCHLHASCPSPRPPRNAALQRDQNVRHPRKKQADIGTAAPSAGWIYIYSFGRQHRNVHVFNEATQEHRRLVTSKALMLLQRILRGRQPMMLVKIGFTTATPEIRANEWRRKCKHPISLLMPKKSQSIKGFDSKMLGWRANNARDAETHIHEALRLQYGAGKVECHGCAVNGKSGRHREWFYIPVSDLQKVMALIDASVRVC